MSTPADGPPGSTDVVLPLPMSEQDPPDPALIPNPPPEPPQDPSDDPPT